MNLHLVSIVTQMTSEEENFPHIIFKMWMKVQRSQDKDLS